MTPSCVAFNNTGRFIGDAAMDLVTMNPLNTVYEAKRLIGWRFTDASVQSDIKFWPFKVIAGAGDKAMVVVNYKGAEKKLPAEEISSVVLHKMCQVAEDYYGSTVKNAIVTVPAHFNDCQRRATLDAGAVAGLNVIKIINESTAAAIAYSFDKASFVDGRNVLIFDLGGGTLDVSLVSFSRKGIFNVMATARDTHLRGQDFVNRMLSHFVWELKRKKRKDISGNPRAIQRLRSAYEKAMRTLSFADQTAIEIDSLYEGTDFYFNISRARFEELNKDLFVKCIDMVEKCLSGAMIDKSSVHDVVLVGGSARIPKVQQLLQDFFNGKKLCKTLEPDKVVASGAAIYANMFRVNRKMPNVSFREVAPFSLGLSDNDGLMKIVIPCNAAIPTLREIVLATADDNQTTMPIKIFEGERRWAVDNNCLGHFRLSGIPPAPKGVWDVRVWFCIDANGILTVDADAEVMITDQGNISRITDELTITNEKGDLSEDEIERMIKDAEKHKAEDEEHKKNVKAKTALENFIYSIIVRSQKMGSKFTPSDKKKLGDVLEQVMEWLTSHEVVKREIYKNKMEELEKMWHPIIENMNEGSRVDMGRIIDEDSRSFLRRCGVQLVENLKEGTAIDVRGGISDEASRSFGLSSTGIKIEEAE